MVGTMALYASRLTVPGGDTIPIAAITKTGVLPHATRRGVLGSMFFAAAMDMAARGEAAMAFYPSEAVIYRKIVLLRPGGAGHAWEGVRFSSSWGRTDSLEYLTVAPEIVVEFEGDTAVDHGRWRHPVRVARVRAEMHPMQVPKFGESGESPREAS